MRERILNSDSPELYYSNGNVSQSELKLLTINPRLVTNNPEPDLFFEEKLHFTIGSAVDCKLTQEDKFYDIYYESTVESKPTDVVKSIIHEVFNIVKDEEIKELDHEDYFDFIVNSCNNHNYRSNWGNDKRVNIVIKDNLEYWLELKNSLGKVILSREEIAVIMIIT